MSVLFAFLASLSWGFSDFIGGFASKKDFYLTVALIRGLLELALFSLLLIAVPGVFGWTDFGIGVGVGSLAGVALPLFFYALANGRMSVVGPVTGLVGVAFPIAAGIGSGERPSVQQLVGLMLAVVSVVFISVHHSRDEDGSRQHHFNARDIAIATVCGLTFGCYFVGLHHTSADSGSWPVFGVAVGVVTVQLLLMFRRLTLAVWQVSRRGFVLCAVGAGLEGLAGIAYLTATREGLLSITAGVSSLYPVFTALLAFVVLKEPLSRVNALGLAMCTVSLVLIAV